MTCRNRNQCELRTDQNNGQIKTTRQTNGWRTTLEISENQWDGNILKTQNKGYKQTTQNYRYDDLYQLVHADGNYTNTLDPYKRTTSYTQDFTYDDIGNMTVKTSTRQVKPVNTNKTLMNYKYDYTYDNNSPHRATVIGDWKYTYDDNGNVTNIGTNSDPNNGETGGQLSGGNYGETHGLLSDPDTNNGETHGLLSNPAETGSNGSTSNCTTDRDDQYIWNEENRLVQTKISGESTFYVYNAGGERTIKYNSKDNETLYVDKFFQVENRDLVTKHIFVGDTRIVSKLSYMKSVTADDKGFEEQNQYYYHSDHLGSTTFVSDYQGKEYQHTEYAPYGESWVDEESDQMGYIKYLYTSKEYDSETGFYNFGQRYYDAITSRWMSADPIYDGVRSGLSLYGYCYNNPLIYHDPNGLETKSPGYTCKSPLLDKIMEEVNKKVAEDLKEKRIKEQRNPNKKLDSSVKRYGDSVSANMNYATQDIVDTIKESSEQYKKETGNDMYVGDLSLNGGAKSDRHKSADGKVYDHLGYSADIKQGTDDGTVGSQWYKDTTTDKKCDPHYSAANTIKMISIINETASQHNLSLKYVIFADPDVYGSDKLNGIYFSTDTNSKISGLLGIHQNHIHIEFTPIIK
jgi:RHS repeat-associated protein